ncbi:MAG: hypothetical protein R3E95_01230 [Thiolinea sp.]
MSASTDKQHYYVPHSTIWPFMASIGLTGLILGVIRALNGGNGTMMLAGALVPFFTFWRWFAKSSMKVNPDL